MAFQRISGVVWVGFSKGVSGVFQEVSKFPVDFKCVTGSFKEFQGSSKRSRGALGNFRGVIRFKTPLKSLLYYVVFDRHTNM